MSEPWVRRAVAAEVNGRRVNEAIEGEAAGRAVFVCECGRLECSATVALSIAEYEAVRTDFDRFLLVPGHEIDGLDQVVERHDGYLVAVKREGEPKELARLTNPRGR